VSTPTYDPARWTVSLGGRLLTGFVAETWINIKPNSPAFTYHPGARGKGARARNRDTSVQITLTLLQTSDDNDVLQAMYDLDQLLGTGIKELVVKELDGPTQFVGEVWVREPPPLERGVEIGGNPWVLECAEPSVYKIGGITQ